MPTGQAVSFDAFCAYCVAHGITEPEREVTGLVPGRKFRCDYVFREAGLVVESEGGIWSRGRAGMAHRQPTSILRDMKKANALTVQGWKILRYTPQQLTDGTALADLLALVVARVE